MKERPIPSALIIHERSVREAVVRALAQGGGGVGEGGGGGGVVKVLGCSWENSLNRKWVPVFLQTREGEGWEEKEWHPTSVTTLLPLALYQTLHSQPTG